ncbi:hypothetical protein M9458_043714, partial [Cirrhinus mrigala]
PPSVWWARHGSDKWFILLWRHGWWIPRLRLGPPTLRLCPGSWLSRLHHRPTSSTGLPRPSGSALVGHRPAIASGLHSSTTP